MKKLKLKSCSVCGNEYQPTGSCSKYCSTCRPVITKQISIAAINRWHYKKGILNGKGSGSSTGNGKANHMYKHGLAIFQKYAKEMKETVGLCEECGKDIKNSSRYGWVGHHKDHNRQNNDISNLKLMCKSCHQIEHECWKAFEGVTTISKESRDDNIPKRLAPQQVDDDIVCSA